MGIADEKKFILGDDTKDVTYSSSNNFKDELEAKTQFLRSIEKLFNIDEWTDLPGISSRFELHAENGEKKNASRPVIGDHVKIILPGLPLDNWVVVTDLKVSHDSAEFTVSPCNDPTAH